MLNGQQTLLLIDKNQDDLKRTRQVLEAAGYKVLCAADGRESLELVASQQVDQVILEHQVEPNGACMAAAIRKAQPAVPILLHSDHESVPISSLNIVDGFMPKGTLPFFLLHAVKLLFRARPAGAANGTALSAAGVL